MAHGSSIAMPFQIIYHRFNSIEARIYRFPSPQLFSASMDLEAIPTTRWLLSSFLLLSSFSRVFVTEHLLRFVETQREDLSRSIPVTINATISVPEWIPKILPSPFLDGRKRINGADSAANCGEIERSGEARIESVSADRKLSRHWNRCLAKVAFDLGSIKSAPGVERLFPPSTRDIQTSIQNSSPRIVL